MLRHVLGLGEPAEQPRTDRIDQPFFGGLVHRIIEAVLEEAGVQICARQGELADWLAIARRLSREQFERFLDAYPLRGRGVVRRERHRLERTVRYFLEEEGLLS